jgi:hypothetical protein
LVQNARRRPAIQPSCFVSFSLSIMLPRKTLSCSEAQAAPLQMI